MPFFSTYNILHDIGFSFDPFTNQSSKSWKPFPIRQHWPECFPWNTKPTRKLLYGKAEAVTLGNFARDFSPKKMHNPQSGKLTCPT